MKLFGEQNIETLQLANNYASSGIHLERLEEAKSVLRKMMPVARRVLGDDHRITFEMRTNYARTLYWNDDATLDNLREAVSMLSETAPTAQRVLGRSHPDAVSIERALRDAFVALRARASSEMRACESAKVQDHNRKYRKAYAAARGEGLAPAAAMRRAAAAVGDPIRPPATP